MKRIDTLTKAQAARFGEWSKKWIEIGLSTEPADFDRATAAALKAYEVSNLKKPMLILRVQSPYAACIAGVMAWQFLRKFYKAQVGDQVRAQVWDQVRAQVWAQVRDQVRAQVWDQVRDQVWAQVWDQVGDQYKEGLNNFSYMGQFWSNWASWVSFFRDVCGLEGEFLKKFEIGEELIKSCGFTWWHQNVFVISDRPSIINRDEQNRLHCETGPSIAYRDGWSLHHWHGVKVDAYVIENPTQITVDDIEKESNVEVRRVKIERYGQARYLTESGAEEIHRDDFGILYSKDVPNDEPIVMVKVVNSTPEPDGHFKDYFIRVDPKMKRAHQAVAWTFGKTEDNYAPCLET